MRLTLGNSLLWERGSHLTLTGGGGSKMPEAQASLETRERRTMRRLNDAARRQSQCERSRLDATQEPVGREVWLPFAAFQAGRERKRAGRGRPCERCAFSGPKEIYAVCFPSDWSEVNATA